MKKLFTLKSSSTTNRILIILLLCITVGTQSLWAQSRPFFNKRSDKVNANATSATVKFSDYELYPGYYASQASENFHCVGIGNITVSGTPTITGNGNDSSVSIEFSKGAGSSKGGAIIVWFDWNFGNNRDFCVINVPSTCNDETKEDLVWDLKTVNGPTQGSHPWYMNMTDDNFKTAINSEWVTKFKVRQVDRDPRYYNGPAFAAKEVVKGNNAYYIPETAGLLIDTQDRKESFGVSCGKPESITDQVFYESTSPVDYVNSCTYSFPSFGNDNNPQHSGSGTTKLTIPNLKPGWYVKLYWGRHADDAGGTFTASGVTDLEGRNIDGSFTITRSVLSNETNDYYGATTFIVKQENGQSTTDVSFYLQDNGWTNLFKIVVCKDYKTEFRLVSGDWDHRYPVVYDKENGKYTSDNISLVTIGSDEEIQYTGWPQFSLIQDACRTDWKVTPDTDGGQNLLKENEDYKVDIYKDEKDYVHCKITALKDGTRSGNLLITQRSIHGDYVLDKNETWIAIGRVTPKKYPYTWDFTEYNMSDDRAANGGDQTDETGKNINSNTFLTLLNTREISMNNENGNVAAEAFRLYGSWGMKDGTYDLYTYPKTSWEYRDGGGYHSGSVPYLDSFRLPMDKPLFAQGSQFVYATYANYNDRNYCTGTANVKEFEGLGMTVEAIGEGKYGHIEGEGNGHLFGVTEILVPAVDAGMSIFMETAADMPTPTVYVGDTQQGTDSRAKGSSSIFVESKKQGAAQYVSTKVYGWMIPAGGDVRITGLDASKKIYRIGVTNLFKTINKYGYATESRNVAIDHMMTSVFGKADAHAYVINEFTSEESRENNKEQIGYVTFVPAQASVKKEKEYNAVNTTQNYESIPPYTGVILWTGQTEETKDDIEVPLFYPACNVPNTIKFNTIDERFDNNGNKQLYYTGTKVDIIDEGKNLVLPSVTASGDGVSVNGANGDFILTNVYAYRSNIDNIINGGFSDIGFYYSKPGTLSGNKSYLHLDNAQSLSKAVFILFGDIDNDDNLGITTGVRLPYSSMDKNNGVYYNLNGLQLNGQPSKPGIYVRNGKKVVVK